MNMILRTLYTVFQHLHTDITYSLTTYNSYMYYMYMYVYMTCMCVQKWEWIICQTFGYRLRKSFKMGILNASTSENLKVILVTPDAQYIIQT